MDLFEHLGSFLERLDIYTKIQLTPIMMGIIVKIMAEILSVLALATKQIKERRFSKWTVAYDILCFVAQRATEKFGKKLLGGSEIEDVLQKLNQLTEEEARIAVAETLGLVHGLVGNVKLIMEGERCVHCSQLIFRCLLPSDRETSMDSIRRDSGMCPTQNRYITHADLGSKPLFSMC